MGFRCFNWLLVIAFVLSVGFQGEPAGAHGRRQLLPSLETADDGVCTAVVSPQGYECREYEVAEAVGTKFLEAVCAMPGVNCFDLMASLT
ncbi:hypothetical protein BHE74_00047554, partial [Ensete ventricosum]